MKIYITTIFKMIKMLKTIITLKLIHHEGILVTSTFYFSRFCFVTHCDFPKTSITFFMNFVLDQLKMS